MEGVLLLLGCCIGSFLNVLIDRFPVGEDVVFSRSHCDHCRRTLAWYELIPVLSWCFQRGKSRCCHRHISIQYPLVELVTGIGFIFLYRQFGISTSTIMPFLGALLLFCSSLGIFVADCKTELIPVVFLYMSFFAILLVHVGSITSCILGSTQSCMMIANTFIIPASIGAGFFFLLWLGTKGKAMGDGDIFIAGIIGLALGYPTLIIAYYAAFLTGALAGVILILLGKKRLKSHIAFGPFLIFGLGIASTFGNVILSWWSRLW